MKLTFDEMESGTIYYVENRVLYGNDEPQWIMRHKKENADGYELVMRSFSDFEFVHDRKQIDDIVSKCELRERDKTTGLLLPDPVNNEICELAKRRHPSDHILVTEGQINKLKMLWAHGQEDGQIPTDIFYAGTIPLVDCIVTVVKEKRNDSFRTMIFEKENAIKTERGFIVGAILYPARKEFMIAPIAIDGETKQYYDCGFGYNIEFFKLFANLLNEKRRMEELNDNLTVWYSIQIALLHPAIKEIFKNPVPEVLNDEPKKIKHSQKRRIVRYVRKHVVEDEKLDKAIYGEHKEKQQHTFVWYVIGHWRELKSGRKVFVNPYWKGPLRELKRNLDERQREIVMPEV